MNPVSQRRAFAAALFAAVSFRTLSAQTIRLTHLPTANATLAEEFSDISSVRELSDGRVIVTDRRDNRIGVADFRANTFETIGKKGQGPGEYTQALPVRSIGGDSSVLIIPRQRWLIFSGIKIVATLPADAPAVAAARGVIRGVNSEGYVFSAADLASDAKVLGDSVVLLRTARASGKVDTIARMKAVVPKQTSAPNSAGFMEFSVPTLRVAEEAVPFADGSVAIVRLDPYRVDWRSSDGKWRLGKPLPFAEVVMNDTEKNAYVSRAARSVGKPAQSIETIGDWPKIVPPYLSPASLFATPDGRVAIARLETANHPETRYDIVSRTGMLDSQLVLTDHEHVVGFGSKTIYTVLLDDDGVQHLRRHLWTAVTSK